MLQVRQVKRSPKSCLQLAYATVTVSKSVVPKQQVPSIWCHGITEDAVAAFTLVQSSVTMLGRLPLFAMLFECLKALQVLEEVKRSKQSCKRKQTM